MNEVGAKSRTVGASHVTRAAFVREAWVKHRGGHALLFWGGRGGALPNGQSQDNANVAPVDVFESPNSNTRNDVGVQTEPDASTEQADGANADGAKGTNSDKPTVVVPPPEEPVDVSDRDALEEAIGDRKEQLRRRFEKLEGDIDHMHAAAKIALILTGLTVISAAIIIPLTFGAVAAVAAVLSIFPAAFGGGALAEVASWGHQYLLVRRERQVLLERQTKLKELEDALEQLNKAEEEQQAKTWRIAAAELIDALGLPNPFGPPKPEAPQPGAPTAQASEIEAIHQRQQNRDTGEPRDGSAAPAH